MGFGKTTRLMIYLQEIMNETIYITMPNVMLAYETHRSLEDAVKAMDKDIQIGFQIQGNKVEGHIVVQTPYYLQPGCVNVIDEFQFLSFHNLDYFRFI